MMKRYLFHLLGLLAFLAVASSFATGTVPLEFKESDFKSAQLTVLNNEILVEGKLSGPGLQKVKQINETLVGAKIGVDIAGVRSQFKVREPIKGEELQMGPFSAEDGKKIVRQINH